ncbi:MAG: peptidyl-prolyl cis-trans isomerase [Pseudomonadota bacterium]
MAGKGKGKISNIFVWIILGLLIVALAGFGVSGFGGNVRSVAAVGDSEVDVNVYARALQRDISQMTQARGEAVTFAEAQALGLDRAILQALLAQAALEESARRAGLSVGDETVSEQILALPNFIGADGTFDREAYQFALENNGMSVAQFEQGIRNDITRNLLQAAVVGGVRPQPAFVDAIYSYVAERRAFTYAVLGEAELTEPVATPDDAAVQAYYDAHPEEFTAPELRRITYAILTPDMLIDSVELDEDALRRLYEDRSDQYNRPAMRMVDRLGFADEAAAAEAKRAIDAGETTFDALVAERGLTSSDVDLNTVTEAQLDDAGAEVFALEEPGVVGPLPSSIGPALFQVNALLTEQVTPFEEALPELREELANQRARRLIEDEIEPLDDLLAGGATIEELADESDMELGQIDWSGTESDGAAGYGAFQAVAAQVRAGDFPEIETLEDGGIFALRLDEIVPPTLRPFEEVRAEAQAGARAEAIKAALRTRADEIKAGVDGGEDFPALGVTAFANAGLTRNDFLDDLPPALLPSLFEMEPGDVSLIEGDDTLVVVRLDQIRPADLTEQTAVAVRERLNGEIAEAMAQDLLGQFAQSVQSEAGITVNDAALNAVHTQLP